MGAFIYTRAEQGRLETLTEERFSTEDDLQALIAEHPELLAGEQIRPDNPLRWILITREKGIAETSNAAARWAIDHLIIDQDAVPTLVEVKRGSNSEIRRTIVGQLLEYAAHAAQTWTAEELRRAFEESTHAKGLDPGNVLATLLQSDGEPDADGFWQDVSTNLDAKRLRLLFVADDIPDPLKRVVEFLNGQMPAIEVLAVEIKQFRGNSTQILVPQVIGRTAAFDRGQRAQPLTHESFLAGFGSDKATRGVAERLLKVVSELEGTLEWQPNSVSVRMRCSVWPQPVTVAWLYLPEKTGWFRDFSFGAGILHYEPPPVEALRGLLERWIGQFSGDAFAKDVSNGGFKVWAISYADAVHHVGLLVKRLTTVLSELKSL